MEFLYTGDKVLYNKNEAIIIGFMKNGEVCLQIGNDVIYARREDLMPFIEHGREGK